MQKKCEFEKNKEYQQLAKNCATFMELPADKDSKNFHSFLTGNPDASILTFAESLNFIFQILKAYEFIEKSQLLYAQNRFALNLKNWYIEGKVLRTDNFHPANEIISYKKENDFENFFKYSEKGDSKEKLNKNLLHDIGLLLFRILTGFFFKEENEIKKVYFVQNNESLNNEISEVIRNMYKSRISVQECADILLKLYKKAIFCFFLDLKDYPLNQILFNYSLILHRSLKYDEINRFPSRYNDKIKFNLIVGHFILFLRNLVCMPINYQIFNKEIYFWIEEASKNQEFYEICYENYFGSLFMYNNDLDETPNDSKWLQELISTYDYKRVFSLRQIETSGSTILTSNDILSKKLKEIFLPFKNYDTDCKTFYYNLNKAFYNQK